LASQVADTVEDWRRDNVRVRIAKAHTWLGDTKAAERYEAGVVDSEAGKVAGVRATVGDEDSLPAQIKSLDAIIALGNFDSTRNALESYAQLFRRFSGDSQRRAEFEAKIRGSWSSMPLFIRIDLLSQLAGFAIDAGDLGKALELVNEAQEIFDGAQWPVE